MITNIVIISAYCACKLCCGPNAHNRTADGHIPQQGITIAASRKTPFGTIVTIRNHNYIVQDRLATKYDNRIDIFFDKHSDALRWGIKRERVVIKEK